MFTDRMVLQQGIPVPVWGKGIEGNAVTVRMQGQSVTAAAHNGTWLARLEPLSPGGPYELTVESGEALVVLSDVLVGEVWLAGGQSNMEQQLLFIDDGVQEAESELPVDGGDTPIRFFATPRRPFEGALVPGWHFQGQLSEPAEWQLCTPRTALHFSAIGYSFARRLQAALGVPVGIVSCAFGGTPIEAWMDADALAEDPQLAPIMDAYRREAARLEPEQYERHYAEYIEAIYGMIEERGDIEGRIRELGLGGYRAWVEKNPLRWPDQRMGTKHYQRPGGLYRTMLRTVVPYAIRGALWYQGESNAGAPALYARLLQAMIGQWRRDWESPALPFLVVQLPPFMSDGELHGSGWAAIRAAQQAVADGDPNVSLVVALDCGEARDIHPIRKRPIAERLALAALADVYGEAAEYEAPRCVAVTADGARLRLAFDGRGGGLRPADAGQQTLAGFDISGEDGSYVAAKAGFVDDRTIEVWAEAVEAPTGVRYAWADWPAYSLFGRNGIPVGPFSLQ